MEPITTWKEKDMEFNTEVDKNGSHTIVDIDEYGQVVLLADACKSKAVNKSKDDKNSVDGNEDCGEKYLASK